ncbi:CYTH-like domain-containing protein [Zopfochytrium polystomum]|nr:CYTH-like domain-containing protein [Zopfochytrium polystomum]
MIRHTEIELKLRLSCREDLDKIEAALKNTPGCVHLGCNVQTDSFFDGADRPLLRQKTVFRIRSISKLADRGDRCADAFQRYVATLKSGSVIVDGVMTATEEECEAPGDVGEALLRDPTAFNSWRGRGCVIADRAAILVESNGNSGLEGFSRIGGYVTERNVWKVQEVVVEVDHTKYDFGEAFEVEVETPDIVLAENILSDIFSRAKVEKLRSKRNKFDNMLAGTIA